MNYISEALKTDMSNAAFPIVAAEGEWCATGMTLRDYFAAKCAPSILLDVGRYQRGETEELTRAQVVAKHAYAIADAMLKARK